MSAASGLYWKVMLDGIRSFLGRDLWRIRARRLPRRKSVWIGFLRVAVLTLSRFRQNNCALRASALTFYSLMSVVPVLAMAFGVAKGFGVERHLEDVILREIPSQEEVLSRAIRFAARMLQNTSGGAVAGAGVVFLLWAIIRMLGQIESAFNDIWGVKRGRTWGRKFTDYVSLTMVFPLVFVLAGSLNVFLAGLAANAGEYPLPEIVGPALFAALPLLSFAVICGFLSFLYVYIPNTRVRLRAGIVGGVAAALIYEAVQWTYIHAQIFFSGIGAVYGSFAALPLFLTWLQASWLVVLLGAEMAFAVQNRHLYEFEPDALLTSFAFKRVQAVRIAALVCSRFESGEKALDDEELAERLDLPIRLCRALIELLVRGGILAETRDGDGLRGYAPALATEAITLSRVVGALEHAGVEDLPVGSDETARKIEERFADLARRTGELGGAVPVTRWSETHGPAKLIEQNL